MDTEIDLNLKAKNLGRKRSDESKKIFKILKYQDPYIILFKLKAADLLDKPLIFDEEMMDKFYSFMKLIKNNDSLIELDVDCFLENLLINIKTDSRTLLLKCFGLIHCNIEQIRLLISYKEIYDCYIKVIKDIFKNEINSRQVRFMIRILNNNILAYKGVLPIIQKINQFIRTETVEKSIVQCCVVIKGIVDEASDILDHGFNLSIISYLTDMLYEPENYLFLGLSDAKSIAACLNSCMSITNTENKKFITGILRKTLAYIKKYKDSTIYEEALCVTILMEICGYLIELNIRNGISLNFIDTGLFYFDFMCRNEDIESGTDIEAPTVDSTKKLIVMGDEDDEHTGLEKEDEVETQKKLAILNEKPFASSYNEISSQVQEVIDYFYSWKYFILEKLHGNQFDRIDFYNSLSKIRNPTFIFNNIDKFKEFIDWADLIVFACNSTKKELYLSVLFDDFYMKNPTQIFYIKIMMMNLELNNYENRKVLLFFIKYVLRHHLIEIISHLYLIHLDEDDDMAKKKRILIMEYFNMLGNDLEEIKEPEIEEKNSQEEPKENLVIEFNDDSNFEDNFIYDEDRVIYKLDGNENKVNDLLKPTKKVVIETEERVIPGTTFLEIEKNIMINEIVEGKGNDLSFSLRKYIVRFKYCDEIDILVMNLINDVDYKAHKNLNVLLLIITSKRLRDHTALCLFEKTVNIIKENSKKNLEMIFKEECVVLISICSLIANIYKIQYYKEDLLMKTFPELIIQVLSFTNERFDEEYIHLVKSQGFHILMKMKAKYSKEISKIYRRKAESIFVAEYKNIFEIIKENDPDKLKEFK